jgi:hypothetical protein
MPDTMIHKPITFVIPYDIHTRNTSHLVVQPLPGRYILSFFECLPPLVIGNTDSEKQRELEKIQSIPATCVARLMVAESDLAGFLQVLQQQQMQMKQQGVQGFKAFA